MSGTNNTPAGWYPAPDQPGQERYWDGARWTDTYQPVAAAPPPGPPGAPGVPGAAPGWATQGAGWQPTTAPPQNYLVHGILATLFCCLPFGIVSIVKASQVNSFWQQGRAAEAQAAADSAKQWAIISAAVGVVAGVLWVLLIAGSSSSSGF